MIFVTVGGHTPFDRMVAAVDDWAGKRNRHDVFAQIGQTAFRPRNIRWCRFLSPAEYEAAIEGASLVVGHAGIGTILSCSDARTPLLVMPRRSALGETRNDHQDGTASHFFELGAVRIARTPQELEEALSDPSRFRSLRYLEFPGAQQLCEKLRQFIAAT